MIQMSIDRVSLKISNERTNEADIEKKGFIYINITKLRNQDYQSPAPVTLLISCGKMVSGGKYLMPASPT